MKKLNLALMVSAAALIVSGMAQADDTTTKYNHHQNLSKRPYHQPVVENKKADGFEGATLVTEEKNPDQVSKHKSLRINMLGQRPYIEDVR